jgi:hypothetical protein
MRIEYFASETVALLYDRGSWDRLHPTVNRYPVHVGVHRLLPVTGYQARFPPTNNPENPFQSELYWE